MFKLDLEKAEEPEIKLPTSVKSKKKQGNFRKTSTSESLTMLKPLTVWIINWKIHKEMGLPDHLTTSWESCMQVKKQQLEPDMEQQTVSKLGKEYVKAYIVTLLLYQGRWSTRNNQDCLGEISIISDMQILVVLPAESQGWGSLVGCCLWGRTESDRIEMT